MFIVWLLFIQIVAESLPISSSGHVLLMERLYFAFGYDQDITCYSWIVDFLSHGPTIAIVLLYFFSTWWQMLFLQKPHWALLRERSSYIALLKPMVFVLVADIITFLFWTLDLAHIPIIQQYFLPIGFLITAMILYCSHKLDRSSGHRFWLCIPRYILRSKTLGTNECSESQVQNEGGVEENNFKILEMNNENATRESCFSSSSSSCSTRGSMVDIQMSCKCNVKNEQRFSFFKKIVSSLRLRYCDNESYVWIPGSSPRKTREVNNVIQWSLCNAIILGIVQGLSLLPGISRFASTYGVGIFLGYQRSTSFALSFLIQFPLLLAGFVKALLALHGATLQQALIYEQIATLSFGVVMLSATLISAVLFYWVGRLIEQNRLWYFAYYMIIPLIISFAL